MAFMNKKRPNKVVLWIFIILISAGLLGSVSAGYLAGSSSGISSSVTGNSPEVNGNNYMDQAMQKVQSGDAQGAKDLFEQALSQYEEAIKATPDNVNVLGDMSVAYYYTGNVAKAMELAEKALKINPSFTQARFNYAIFLGDGQRKYLDAIKELQKIKPNEQRYQEAQQLIQQFYKDISGNTATPKLNGNQSSSNSNTTSKDTTTKNDTTNNTATNNTTTNNATTKK